MTKALEIIGKHVEDLSVKLSDEEVMERGNRLANIEGEIERHTSHETNVKADLKATRSRLEAERGRIAQQVRSRSELRPIEVEIVADFKAGLVRDIRVDTCATVRTRALSEAERQGALKLHAEGERINKGKLTPEERERMEAEAAALTPAFEEQEQQ
jgi:hypothetical protein